jgi:hypothetical protein
LLARCNSRKQRISNGYDGIKNVKENKATKQDKPGCYCQRPKWVKMLVTTDLPVAKSGYLFVYLSSKPRAQPLDSVSEMWMRLQFAENQQNSLRSVF